VAHPQIAVFARLADGGAKPVRKIEGQKTMLGRTMHSIVYDERHDEFVVPQQFGQAILTFRGGADGEEAPIRVIQGSLTELRNPDRLAVDPVHDEIFVPQGNQVLVFARAAKGNVAPIRILRGPDTKLGANALAVDPVHDLLIVGGRTGGESHLLIFNRTAEGNAKPKAVIGGPKSGLAHISGPFAVYPARNEIVVSVRGSGSESNEMATDDCFVGVWSTEDNGDVPPRWTIGGPKGVLRMVRGVDLDPKNKSVIVTDKRLNAVLTFYFPEMF
jgi:hypothetical protein